MAEPVALPPSRALRELRPDQLRLLARVARMYYEQGLRQPQIAAQLHVSQSRVSRLLRQATDAGIVRTVVSMPRGVYTEIEERVQTHNGLRDVVVVDIEGSQGDVIPALGAATAAFLNETLIGFDVIGISSWSSTLLAAVDIMRPKSSAVSESVVQMFGGVGEPAVQVQATRLLSRFADITGARPIFMPTPGVVSTPEVREAVIHDAAIHEVTEAWNRLTVTLVGIGSLDPSPLLFRSGNAIAAADQDQLRELGAVGDVCLRFFDRDGQLVQSRFNDRVLGITPEQLKQVDRRIGVAGGAQKYSAIRAAVLGGWINVLITDIDTARRLQNDTETANLSL